MRTWMLLGLLALIPTAAAHGEVELNLEMHDGGGEFWFQFANGETKNPTILMEPGTAYHITLENKGSVPHDFHLDVDGDGESDIRSDDAHGGDLVPGETASLEFTLPSDAGGDASYWCQPHKGIMEGSVDVSAHGDGEDSPGAPLAILLGTVAAVAALRRR